LTSINSPTWKLALNLTVFLLSIFRRWDRYFCFLNLAFKIKWKLKQITNKTMTQKLFCELLVIIAFDILQGYYIFAIEQILLSWIQIINISITSIIIEKFTTSFLNFECFTLDNGWPYKFASVYLIDNLKSALQL